MQKLHIVIPLHDFNAGGTERIALRLAGKWADMGQRVTLLVGAQTGPLIAALPADVDVVEVDPARPRSATSRLFLGRHMQPILAKLAPEAIFLPGNYHFLLAPALKQACPSARMVAKISNPILPSLLPHRLGQPIFSRLTAGVDSFVAMDQSLAEDARRMAGGRPVTIIADPFLEDDAPIMARTGRPIDAAGPLHLICVGRPEAQKNPELALQTLARLRNRDIAATLIWLGGNVADQSWLNQMATALGIADRAQFPGFMSETDAHYQAASLFFLPSRFEGVPAALGEALSHGLPFVATPCSPWVQALAHAGLGRVTDNASPDALADAIIAQAQCPYPSQAALTRALDGHRLGAAASDYLASFRVRHAPARTLPKQLRTSLT